MNMKILHKGYTIYYFGYKWEVRNKENEVVKDFLTLDEAVKFCDGGANDKTNNCNKT